MCCHGLNMQQCSITRAKSDANDSAAHGAPCSALKAAIVYHKSASLKVSCVLAADWATFHCGCDMQRCQRQAWMSCGMSQQTCTCPVATSVALATHIAVVVGAVAQCRHAAGHHCLQPFCSEAGSAAAKDRPACCACSSRSADLPPPRDAMAADWARSLHQSYQSHKLLLV